MDRKEFLRENWEKVVFFCIAVAGAVLDLLSKSAVFSSLGVVVQHDEKGSPFVRGERTIGLIGDTLSFRPSYSAFVRLMNNPYTTVRLDSHVPSASRSAEAVKTKG